MKIPSDDIVYNLIPGYVSGNISDEDRVLVEVWATSDPANKRTLNEYVRIWEYAGEAISDQIEMPIVDIDEEWNHHLKLVAKNHGYEGKRGFYSLAGPGNNLLKVAAGFALIFLVVFTVYYFIGIRDTSYYAEDNTKEVSFKDGTFVTLNSGSRINLKSSYNEKARVVDFEGEAYFEVHPDPEKPFIIQTEDARIRVVGTAFNVRAIAGESLIEVTVTSGEVLLQNEEGNKAVALKAEDVGIYNRLSGEISRSDNTNRNFLAWKTGVISFENASLGNVVETLNRIYPNKNLTLAISDSSECSITVSFDNQTLEAILNVLKSTLNLEYQMDGTKIEVTGSGC